MKQSFDKQACHKPPTNFCVVVFSQQLEKNPRVTSINEPLKSSHSKIKQSQPKVLENNIIFIIFLILQLAFGITTYHNPCFVLQKHSRKKWPTRMQRRGKPTVQHNNGVDRETMDRFDQDFHGFGIGTF